MRISKTIQPQEITGAVKRGLSAAQKYLPSWLFYDDAGSVLFREIMTLPEYYLTACEREILYTFSAGIAYNLKGVFRSWDVVELGAGDGTKTGILLKALLDQRINLHYYPIDISKKALQDLEADYHQRLPGLQLTAVHAEYLNGLTSLPDTTTPRLILFMGANIGNFEIEDAAVFLRSISALLKPGDQLLIGFDLMKSPAVIEKAYYDYKGVTSLFNKNLLVRLNRELDADFNLKSFEHWCIYDAVTGACRSYLVSLKHQSIHFRKINLSITLKAWETIKTEISQKYHEEMIFELAAVSNVTIEKLIYDERRYFSLVFMKGRGGN